MKPFQKMVDNQGVEIALFPEPELIVTQEPNGQYSHQGVIAMDIGGDGLRTYYAPCTLQVKKNNDPSHHEVIFWTVKPVRTKDFGIVDLSIMILHDNDVSDLPVGKVIAQGETCWHSGGFGPNGAYTYGWHSHVCVAIGHTTDVSNWQLVGSVSPDKVFFANDTNIIQTCGMNFANYIAPELAIMENVDCLFCPQVDMKIREYPTTDSNTLGLLIKTSVVEITQKSTNLVNGYKWLKFDKGYCALLDEDWLYAKPIVEEIKPIEPIVEPIVEEKPIEIIETPIETPPNDTIAVSKPVVSDLPIDDKIMPTKVKTLLQVLIELIHWLLELLGKRK